MSEHVHDRLEAVAEGRDPEAAAHVERCASCREELALVREGRAAMASLAAPVATPVAWRDVERRLARPRRRRAALAVAATLVVASVVALLARSPMRVLEGTLSHGVATTRVHVALGTIGEAWADEGSRLRVVGRAPLTLRLDAGSLRVQVHAPPRAFVVVTPDARIVDLGCSYELTPQRVRVIGGSVEVAGGDRSVVVRAGWSCAILAGRGPGAPVRVGASPRLVAAVATAERTGRIDETALVAAAPPDALTLLELLPLLQRPDRDAALARLIELTRPPSTVTYDTILVLDSRSLRAWREELLAHPPTPKEAP